MAGTSTATNKSKAATLEELDGQISQIRDDITGLTKILADNGSSKIEQLSDHAKETAHRVAGRSQEALEALNKEAGQLEAQLMLQVRKKPLTAIGVAAGFGFLAAMLMRK